MGLCLLGGGCGTRGCARPAGAGASRHPQPYPAPAQVCPQHSRLSLSSTSHAPGCQVHSQSTPPHFSPPPGLSPVPSADPSSPPELSLSLPSLPPAPRTPSLSPAPHTIPGPPSGLSPTAPCPCASPTATGDTRVRGRAVTGPGSPRATRGCQGVPTSPAPVPRQPKEAQAQAGSREHFTKLAR